MAVFGHEKKKFKTNTNWSFVIISLNEIMKLKFVFKSIILKETHFGSFRSYHYSFLNWTWFLSKYFLRNTLILLKKVNEKRKKNWFINFFINVLWQRSATIVRYLKGLTSEETVKWNWPDGFSRSEDNACSLNRV